MISFNFYDMFSRPIMMQHNVTEHIRHFRSELLADADVGNGFKAHSVLNIGVDYKNKTNIKKWYVYSIQSELFSMNFPALQMTFQSYL